MKNATLQSLLNDLPADADIAIKMKSVRAQWFSIDNVYQATEPADVGSTEGLKPTIIILIDY